MSFLYQVSRQISQIVRYYLDTIDNAAATCVQVDGGWGYCSPRTVFTQDSCVQDSTQFYAIVGDCNR